MCLHGWNGNLNYNFCIHTFQKIPSVFPIFFIVILKFKICIRKSGHRNRCMFLSIMYFHCCFIWTEKQSSHLAFWMSECIFIWLPFFILHCVCLICVLSPCLGAFVSNKNITIPTPPTNIGDSRCIAMQTFLVEMLTLITKKNTLSYCTKWGWHQCPIDVIIILWPKLL